MCWCSGCLNHWKWQFLVLLKSMKIWKYIWIDSKWCFLIMWFLLLRISNGNGQEEQKKTLNEISAKCVNFIWLISISKVSVWVVGVAGLVAGMAPRTGPRDPGQSNVGLQVGKSVWLWGIYGNSTSSPSPPPPSPLLEAIFPTVSV